MSVDISGNTSRPGARIVNPLLADAVLLVHFAFVVFIVAGFALIIAGGALDWHWVRSRAFRVCHLGAMVFVALEAVAGIACPLTVLEDALRGGASHEGFIARWVSRLLYYDFPAWVFTVAYVTFATLVALAWRWVPPRRLGVSSNA
jgi:hypothetical protein